MDQGRSAAQINDTNKMMGTFLIFMVVFLIIFYFSGITVEEQTKKSKFIKVLTFSSKAHSRQFAILTTVRN